VPNIATGDFEVRDNYGRVLKYVSPSARLPRCGRWARGARAFFAIILTESAALATVGGVGGIVGGHLVAWLAGRLLGSSGLVTDPLRVDVFEPAVLAGIIALGTLAGLLPAVLAYRTEVAENLAPLS